MGSGSRTGRASSPLVTRAMAFNAANASASPEPRPPPCPVSEGRVERHGPRSNADDVKPRNLIYSRLMHLDELPSVRVTDMRRSGDLTPDMSHISMTLLGDDGSPVSTAVRVVRVRMRSGAVFLQFICGYCGRRARVLRLYAGRVMCGRCTGLRYWCEGKPAVRRAQNRVERLKATRFHGSPVSRRPGRTMERRAQLTASLRRSEAVVRRHFAGRILVALRTELKSESDAAIFDA
jgi:uncharacterized Zn finger protein (UPF0148 family)